MTHVSDPVDSSETILFNCSCGQPLRISSKCAGTVISCPKCGTSVVVPPPIPAEEETEEESRSYTLLYLYGGVGAVAVAAALFLFLFIRSTDESRKEEAQAALSQATANATQWLESGDVDEADAVEDGLKSALANPDVTNKQAGERALANVRERRAEFAAEKILANATRQLKNGELDRANSLVDAYVNDPHATDIAAAESLRQQVKTAKADIQRHQSQKAANELFADAKRQLETQRLETAAELLDEYVANPHATEIKEAQTLRQQLDTAASDDQTLASLLQLDDAEFDRAKADGVLDDGQVTHPLLIAVRKETIERNLELAIQRREENRLIEERRREELRNAKKKRQEELRIAEERRREAERLAALERSKREENERRRKEATPGNVTTNSIGMKLVTVPAGEFLMGSHKSPAELAILIEGIAKYLQKEQPLHRVRISKPFAMGAYEVTRGQFREFAEASGYRTDGERDPKGSPGYNAEKNEYDRGPQYSWRSTGFHQTDDHPVVNVSWNDAEAFCRWLSRKEGRSYRLPSEAEWEYACRAGTTTLFHYGEAPLGLVEVGNVADQSFEKQDPSGLGHGINADDGVVFTAPVGSYRANQFGLYDMHGNVWEWCADWARKTYHASSPAPKRPQRIYRGGGWTGSWIACSSARRSWGLPTHRVDNKGFRVVLELE